MPEVTLHHLAEQLQAEVNGGVERKCRNILERAAVETRERWKKAATEFPSATRERSHEYSLGFEDVTGMAGALQVVIGSDDPLLAVLEYGSASREPHAYGALAAEKASKGMNRAAARIDPFRGLT